MEKFSGFKSIKNSLEETDTTACLQDSPQFLNPSHIIFDNHPPPPAPPNSGKKTYKSSFLFAINLELNSEYSNLNKKTSML